MVFPIVLFQKMNRRVESVNSPSNRVGSAYNEFNSCSGKCDGRVPRIMDDALARCRVDLFGCCSKE